MHDDELSDILSSDFWISPLEAKDALDAVRRSVYSLNLDMQTAAEAGTLPPNELVQWRNWAKDFDAYYQTHTQSFADWRLLRSTKVLAEAEQMATDLGAWRKRYEHFVQKRPTTAGPVRTYTGPKSDPVTAALWAVATLSGAVVLARIYRDLR